MFQNNAFHLNINEGCILNEGLLCEPSSIHFDSNLVYFPHICFYKNVYNGSQIIYNLVIIYGAFQSHIYSFYFQIYYIFHIPTATYLFINPHLYRFHEVCFKLAEKTLLRRKCTKRRYVEGKTYDKVTFWRINSHPSCVTVSLCW